jgi:NTE family protein
LVEAFRDLPVEHLAELEQLLITQAVSRGEVLMRQGEAADALYLVASGRFAVNVDGRRIAEVGRGSPLGEIGFFADGIRTATVTALRDSIVLKLPKAEFAAFVERHPIILKPIAVTLARRLADTLAGDEQSLTHPRTLAVIGAAGAPVPDAFRQGLARALSRFGQIATVDSASLAEALPGNVDIDSEAVTSWFNRQELRYHYVLYFADAVLTPFSAKIVRQADQLLIVGAAAEGTLGLSPLERFAFDVHPVSARRLVLIHAARNSIVGTSRCLDVRAVAMHHHLVAGDSAGYDRLARFVSGNARGFVACGGGALCAAHVGV